MSVDGTWRLVIESPMGKQDFSVELKQEGGQLTGTLINNANNVTTDVFDGVVDGDELRWKCKLQQIKMTLSFTARVLDDALSGKVKAGVFGTYNVTGQRG